MNDNGDGGDDGGDGDGRNTILIVSMDLTAEGQDYDNAFTHKSSSPSSATPSTVEDKKKKRNAICEAFYPVLASSPEYFLSSITCLCTFSPPRMEA